MSSSANVEIQWEIQLYIIYWNVRTVSIPSWLMNTRESMFEMEKLNEHEPKGHTKKDHTEQK